MTTSKRQRSLTIDLIIVGFASIAALGLRENFTISEHRWWEFLPYLAFTLAVAGPILIVFQLDRSVWRFSGLADYVRAAGASVLVVIAALAIGFVVNRLDGVSRSLPVLQALVMAAGLVGIRVGVRMVHDRRRRRDRAEPLSLPSASDTVLLVGWGSVTELFVRSVAELGHGSIHIAGILAPNARHVGRLVQSTEVLGRPEDLRDVLATLDVHGIHVGRLVITSPFDQLSEAARQTLLEVESTTDVRLDFFAERLGFDTAVRPDRTTDRSRVSPEPTSAFALDSAEVDRLLRRPYWRMKRAIDAMVALVLLIVLMPVTLLVALLVALDVGVPILFVQQRPGRRGARFNLYKFRTMGPSHDRDGTKISDDARLSRIGAFLRRTRLDELPQLYNILVGDMSFVGPRPLVTREQSSDILARLLVRPGLTGWAQVRGGRVVSVADKTALDLWYVRHASLGLDLKILAATVPMILFGERVDAGAVRLAWRDLRALGVRGRVGERRRVA
jgi:lipopolysaccharide/colanic/teichoic acid biosynthesis glycosyltransferase